jgi:predicted permease
MSPSLTALCTHHRLFLGEGAPLSSLFDALRTMGAAYVPCVLLVLAGSLAQGLEGFDAALLRRAGVVMLQRFVLMPAVTVALVEAGKRAGLVPAKDHLLVFILLLLGCMPSAQNSVLILQLEKRPQVRPAVTDHSRMD